ncbi:uncharacterized protein LOC121519888 [Cheilinus undulatus]|uniref:uncharacterized protein LOC121519888 n=1 Tax=Cheilinus undulatus TaxID=241271 RepID=UPI001BD5E794|nr:uncharacterized protein LOC121519888 [Cheilinus undulatus]
MFRTDGDPIMFLFVILGLLVCSEAQETPVFKQTGTDLLLDVKEVTLEEGHDLTWLFNGRTTIGRLFHGGKPIILGSYKSRAEFFEQNHTLLLKNVQLSDSGVYTARVNSDRVTVVAKHKLTVQDPVSRVELTVKSCSSDWSNLTVICRSLDSLISSTFTCRNQTCSHDGGEGTTPGASLDVYLENGSVICNHSNQVSSEEDFIKIEDLCGETPEHLQTQIITHRLSCRDTHTLIHQLCLALDRLQYIQNSGSYPHKALAAHHPYPHPPPLAPKSHSGSGLSLCMLKIIVVSVGLFIMVCAVISVHVFERLKKKE